MDDSPHGTEAAGLPVQGPHWRHAGAAPDVPPLRLVLQPSGAVIECAQPSVLIGRHSTADVRLPLPEVSRRHCRLVYADGRWELFDLNSLNGVYVNGQKVQQVVLRHRDEVRIGGYVLAVDLLPGERTMRLSGVDLAGPHAMPGVAPDAPSAADKRLAS